MKTIWTIFFFLPLALVAQAGIELEVQAAEGEVITVGNLEVSYTVGEANISTTQVGSLTVSEGFQQPELFALFAGVAADSVWPGDANNDGIAELPDVLAIGIGFGVSGPIRPNASLNWQAEEAPDWLETLASGANYKHIDTDGNGLINLDDTLGISLNLGQTHNKGESGHQTGLSLHPIIDSDTIQAGDTLLISLHVGQDTMPIPGLYGLAFGIEFDTSLIDPSSLELSFDNSWLGQQGQDMLGMGRFFSGNSPVEVVITRLDQLERSGYGAVAQLTIIMIDDLVGKQSISELFQVQTIPILAINAQQESIPLGGAQDSLLVVDEASTGIAPEWVNNLHWYPNPVLDELVIQSQALELESIHFYSLQGKELIYRAAGLGEIRLDLREFAAGTYLLGFRRNGEVWYEKIQVRP